jgi:hypothetical protein
MTAEAVVTLYGSCIAGGLTLGAVVAFFNSWKV